MASKKQSIFYGFAFIAGIFFIGATVWLWRGFLRDQKANEAEENRITTENAEDINFPVETQTAENTNSAIKKPDAISTEIGSTTEIVSTVAVSPLTGSLALGPNDVNLNVPYTSQAPERNWEQPWQDACEEAAILMLDAYYKDYGLSPLSAKDELQRMVDWGAGRGWGLSIDIEKIREFFTEYLGYKRTVRIVENPTVEDIKNFIATGTPVLAVADGKSLPNPYYSNGGPEYHVYIIRGYTADTFITNDPGVNRGANFPFPIRAVMDSLHDWNNGDIKNGRKAVLVVE